MTGTSCCALCRHTEPGVHRQSPLSLRFSRAQCDFGLGPAKAGRGRHHDGKFSSGGTVASAYPCTLAPCVANWGKTIETIFSNGLARLIPRTTMTDFYQRIVAARPTHLGGPGSLSSLVRQSGDAISWYHALGNDYLVIDPRDWPTQFTVPQIVRICHRNLWNRLRRHFVGAAAGPRWRPFALRIFNPDGSEAQKTGNGLHLLPLPV